MAAEAPIGLGVIEAALDMAQGLQDINDSAARKAAVADLTGKIRAAQQAQSALIQQVRELEKEVTRLKDWEADKKRYELVEIAPGIVALAIKETMRNGEPFHCICADCAAKGRKSYLESTARGDFYDVYKCNGCGSVLEINKGTSPRWFVVEDD
jgi:hypothetical protein